MRKWAYVSQKSQLPSIVALCLEEVLNWAIISHDLFQNPIKPESILASGILFKLIWLQNGWRDQEPKFNII